MREIRFVPPGSLVEITGRTFQERFLLIPDRQFTDIVVGALGRAQRLYGIRLHFAVFLSNHYHLLATADSPEQLARFVAYFQAKIGKEVARLRGWRQKTWGRRYRAILVSGEPAAQTARLAYLIQQGVKEGLVGSPRDWPGVHSAQVGAAGTLHGIWFDRTREARARAAGRLAGQTPVFATPETVAISPIPAWEHIDPESRASLFADLIAEAEAIGRRRQRESGSRPLGARAILRQRVDDRPAAGKRAPAPFCHAASRRIREAMRNAYREFVRAYRLASDRLREGFPARFPEHGFLPSLPLRLRGRVFGPIIGAAQAT